MHECILNSSQVEKWQRSYLCINTYFLHLYFVYDYDGKYTIFKCLSGNGCCCFWRREFKANDVCRVTEFLSQWKYAIASNQNSMGIASVFSASVSQAAEGFVRAHWFWAKRRRGTLSRQRDRSESSNSIYSRQSKPNVNSICGHYVICLLSFHATTHTTGTRIKIPRIHSRDEVRERARDRLLTTPTNSYKFINHSKCSANVWRWWWMQPPTFCRQNVVGCQPSHPQLSSSSRVVREGCRENNFTTNGKLLLFCVTSAADSRFAHRASQSHGLRATRCHRYWQQFEIIAFNLHCAFPIAHEFSHRFISTCCLALQVSPRLAMLHWIRLYYYSS